MHTITTPPYLNVTTTHDKITNTTTITIMYFHPSIFFINIIATASPLYDTTNIFINNIKNSLDAWRVISFITNFCTK